ncbi:CPBP family intramembrane glutamic endopeptidase [Alkaliphilus transvaalensis]|uniref:CPBP family intramembrane glutamic endopeptidase n=1 Tax=Alkaliphilus transvaalensis TaxID=114628 RepID=UPI00047AA17D|nr:type II CAAX endopeptidase family protein [Alkaliphilus transvaalensis]
MDLETISISQITKKPLIIVIIVAFLFPTIFFLLIKYFNIEGQLIRYFLTIASAIFMALLALWAMKRDHIFKDEIGLYFKNIGQSLVVIAVMYLILGLTYYLVFGEIELDQRFSFSQMLQQWIFVGMGEELLFRGYLLNRFIKEASYKPKLKGYATILSSIIFATVHIPVRLFNGASIIEILISLVMIFILGIFFSYIFLRTKNIVLVGLVHGNWNVPLMARYGDFLQIIILILVVELFTAFKKSNEERSIY